MELTKEQQIISYIITNVKSSRINRTLIFKLLFLADLEFFSLYNQSITSYNYCFYDHGPFCPEIYSDLDYLEYMGLISSQKYISNDYVEWKYGVIKPININLCEEVIRVIDFVIELGNKFSLSKILEIVYDLPLLKLTNKYESLYLTKMESILEKKEKPDINKYKKIIDKLGLRKNEDIDSNVTDQIREEYIISCKNIESINREFLNG